MAGEVRRGAGGAGGGPGAGGAGREGGGEGGGEGGAARRAGGQDRAAGQACLRGQGSLRIPSRTCALWRASHPRISMSPVTVCLTARVMSGIFPVSPYKPRLFVANIDSVSSFLSHHEALAGRLRPGY